MCSLQEAYNVPTFDPVGLRRRRGCATPLKQQPVRQMDPYMPPTREDVAYEHFTDEGVYTMKGVVGRNVPASATNAARYTARASDTDFYCKNYNICPSEQPALERFTNTPSTKTPAPPQQCSPLQAGGYSYPMSDETKQQFAKAMNAALDDTNNGTTAPKPQQMRKIDMDGVSGYYDEDLEQYLQTKDMVSATMPTVAKVQTPAPEAQGYDPKESPFAVTMDKLKTKNFAEPVADKPLIAEVQQQAPAPASTRSYIFDMFLFVSAGLLVIMLCDQLFRFGVAMGIKETMTPLKPFMEGNAAKTIAEVAS